MSELRETLKRYTEQVSQEDLDGLRWAYELIMQAGLSIGGRGEDWVYDGNDEVGTDTFDEYDLERLAVEVLFPPINIMVNEAYGVPYTSELGYPRAFEEQDAMHKMVLEWIKAKLSTQAKPGQV